MKYYQRNLINTHNICNNINEYFSYDYAPFNIFVYLNMTKKDIAQEFLILSSKGESRKAFELFVSDNFKHHNAYFKGDGDTLMLAMEENAQKNPNKIFDIQRTLEDGNLVAVHSRVSIIDNVFAVMHIFRFEDNKIVELWDFGQAVLPDMINENGMF